MIQKTFSADVAVIMSIYDKTDRGKFLLSLESIINQTLKPNIILIVCDGCKVDSMSEIMTDLNLQGINVKFIGYDLNKGPGFARDYGIRNITNKYIAIMDADDISIETRLQIQYDYMINHPDVSVVGGVIEEFNNVEGIRRFRKVPFSFDEIKKTLMKKSPVNNVTAFFSRDDYIKSGGYPPLRSSEDYCLWGRFISCNFKVINLNETLVRVEFDDTALLRRKGSTHFLNDLYTQRELLNNNLINKRRYIMNVLKYFIFRNLPKFLKKTLYTHILRYK